MNILKSKAHTEKLISYLDLAILTHQQKKYYYAYKLHYKYYIKRFVYMCSRWTRDEKVKMIGLSFYKWKVEIDKSLPVLWKSTKLSINRLLEKYLND